MKKILLIFVILIMVSGTVHAANIGNWNGSLRSWNNTGFSTIKGTMIAAGHTVEADTPMSAATLANDDVFVIGEAATTPSGVELLDLANWTSAGGILLILSDSDASGVTTGNNILAGIQSTLRLSTATPSVAPFPPGVCATDGPPFTIAGQTLATTPGNSASRGTGPIAGDYIHMELYGAGQIYVFGDRSDHNTFNPNASNVNGQLFLNLANCSGGGLPIWSPVYQELFDPTSDQLGLMRSYRDNVLSATASGKFYTDMLYNRSEKAMNVLLDNPELLAQLKVLMDANKDAVRDVLNGNEGVISNTSEIIAFLDAYASKAPPVLSLLARWVKWDMIIHQRRDLLFFGFRLE